MTVFKILSLLLFLCWGVGVTLTFKKRKELSLPLIDQLVLFCLLIGVLLILLYLTVFLFFLGLNTP